MRNFLILVSLLAFCINAAAEVCLVKSGIPQAEIVLAEKARRSAQFAAYELQYHIRKITGVDLPIVSEKKSAGKIRIHVGENEYTREKGLTNAGFQRQEYLISIESRNIILMGYDRDDFKKVNYADWKTFPDMASKDKFGQAGIGGFFAQGTCHAVYDFLERFCNVRWYLPTKLGLEYVPSKTLSVQEKKIRRKPYFHHTILVKELGETDTLHGDILKRGNNQMLDRREAILWARRMRLGGTPFACNHSLYGYYRRFLKTHPEWFAKGYSGRPPQLCYTSPGLIEQVAQDARDFFNGKTKVYPVLAHGDFFAVMPMDNLDICKCEKCQALIKRDRFQGTSVYTDRLSRYYFTFVNEVAKRVAKTNPGKCISTAAYNYSSFPPEGMKIEPNVAIVMCLGIRQPYNLERRNNDLAMVRAWHKAAPSNIKSAWLYFCYPWLDGIAGKYDVFPGFFSKDLIKVFQTFRQCGVRGYIIEPAYVNGGRSAVADQLELYLLTRMFDNPEVDGFKLRKEFFTRYYGKAAVPMEQLYDELEQTFCDTSVPYVDEGVQTQAIAWGKLGTAERMARWEKLLQKASALASSDKEKIRIRLFKDGIWAYMQRGRKEYLKTVPVREATKDKKIMIPHISGNSWERAARFGGFYLNTGSLPDYKVDGLMKYDDKNLYIRMTVNGPEKSFALKPKTSVGFWNDGWIFYFAAKKDRPYCQLLVGPDGSYTARYIAVAAVDWKVKPVIKVGFDKTAKRSIELTLPLTLLPGKKLKAGDRFYCNILRGNPDGSSGWIPTFTAGRDAPSRFGELILQK